MVTTKCVQSPDGTITWHIRKEHNKARKLVAKSLAVSNHMQYKNPKGISHNSENIYIFLNDLCLFRK